MDVPADRQQMKHQLFTALLEATFPLKQGPDPELTLELLIEASEMLRDHLDHELEELRLEQAE